MHRPRVDHISQHALQWGGVSAPGGCLLPREGYLVLGGVPGHRGGVPGPGGVCSQVCLLPGVSAPRGVCSQGSVSGPRGVSARGVYLVLGGVCSWGVYLVPGGGCNWSRGGVSAPGGVCSWGGVPGPRGCLLWGLYLVPGGCLVKGGGVVVSALGGVPGPGGCTWSQGVSAPGVSAPCRDVPGLRGDQVLPPPVNRMTNRCKNITLPQTSFAGGNKRNLARGGRVLVPLKSAKGSGGL